MAKAPEIPDLEDGPELFVDLERGICLFPDGEEGEVTVMVDRDGYPTELRKEAFLAICSHPEGGFIQVPLEDDDRRQDGLH